MNQVFSCELCEISKNTFFTEHLGTTASGECVLCRTSHPEVFCEKNVIKRDSNTSVFL